MKILSGIALIILSLAANLVLAGPYSDSTGRDRKKIDSGIPGFIGPDGPGNVTDRNRVNPRFRAFATEVKDYSPADEFDLDLDFTDPHKALGPPTGDALDVVTLGEFPEPDVDESGSETDVDEPGSITLFFDEGIRDGIGADFAVFENGFDASGGIFGELAYVEASSDCENFARFISYSLTPDPVETFEVFDPTDVFNLPGKHVNNSGVSWGTPFDLRDLRKDPKVQAGLVNLKKIKCVRI